MRTPLPRLPSNTPIQPTPLRGPKIGGILQSDFVLATVPTYRCGAADGQAVSRQLISVAVSYSPIEALDKCHAIRYVLLHHTYLRAMSNIFYVNIWLPSEEHMRDQSSTTRVGSGNVQDEIRRFPLRRLYYVLLPILTIISIFSVTLQNDNVNTNNWKLTTEIKVSTITLTILLFTWLPVLIPWIISFFPRLQSSLESLREGGVEEIEAGILRIKLQPGIKAAAEKYENSVLSRVEQPTASPEMSLRDLELSYRETIATLESASKVDADEASKRIDQLVRYYNRVRDEMPSSPERTRLLTQISSTMWSLMPSTQNFPVRQRLNSPDGGERLSAYKFLEWQPNADLIDSLLPRAAGILETPFGQYSALLALRRTVATNSLKADQEQMIRQILEWSSKLDFMGSDRRYLMNMILAILPT